MPLKFDHSIQLKKKNERQGEFIVATQIITHYNNIIIVLPFIKKPNELAIEVAMRVI